MGKAIVTIVLLCTLHNAALAQFQTVVSPAKIEMAVSEKKKKKQYIKVVNTGNQVITVHNYTRDWWFKAEVPKIFAPANTFERSCASWIALDQSKFELQPGEKRSIPFTLAVPPDAEGGHYAVIFFRVEPKPKKGASLQIRFGSRIGVLIAQFDPKTSAPDLKIVGGQVEPPTDAEPLRLTVDLENPSNVHVKPTGTAALISKTDGRYISHFRVTSWPQLLPGQAKDATGEWAGVLPPGEYEALVTLSYFNSKAATKRIPFTVPEPGDSPRPAATLQAETGLAGKNSLAKTTAQ